MSDAAVPDATPVPVAVARHVDQVCDRFEAAWKAAGCTEQRPRIEDYLVDAPELERSALLRELIVLEVERRCLAGQGLRPEEYLARFPILESHWLAGVLRGGLSAKAAKNPPDRTGPWQAGASAVPPAAAAPFEPPQRIGRYRVEKLLGQGGFGRVYLARDEQLQRCVAVKVPHSRLVAQPEDAGAYLTEARTAANLDHPHIVPVYDVGSTAEYPCFIVSKFVAGRTLAQKIMHDRPSFSETAAAVATVAEALHYAHRNGLVHRDIKPGNILFDDSGRPYLTDFGLALKEENIGQGPKYAGTPAYMSPEQARGEGHRVDGRSDLFSLGVVFYELLTGRQPFRADSKEELLEQITTFEPRPPRQYDDTIPKELERICHKALAKRAVDRYSTAKDLAEDLRQFLAPQTAHQPAPVPGSPLATPIVLRPSPAVASGCSGTPFPTPATPTSDSPPITIVPKGRRSFEAQDADFFLELPPGPRDREGLPDSIRFWKTRIEETDADNTFSVGLIYGPSGCGKSSLVKAGLLPRLSEQVLAVYIEATAGETKTRLLNGLRKRCPALPANRGLKKTLAALRRGQGLPLGKKVLIVLDQFEQWLHARRAEQNTELVQALRQCDGGRVQGIVLVRDDFWLAATRFLGELEINLVQGENTALANLFDQDHAKNVLAAFGRACVASGGRISARAWQAQKEALQLRQERRSGHPFVRDRQGCLLDFAILAVGFDDADVLVDGAVGGRDFDRAEVHEEQVSRQGADKARSNKEKYWTNRCTVSLRFWAEGGAPRRANWKNRRF